jgi:hypothetical protein
MSELPEGEIPPGKQVPVRVASKIQQEEGEFSHSALIFTNDPRKKQVKLTVTGTIRDYAAADPPRIVFGDLRSEAARSARSVVYSQVWERATISEVKPSREDLTWAIKPADPDRLAELNARSGYEVEVTAPAEASGGKYDASLEISLAPEDAEGEPRKVRLQVTGSVPALAYLQGEKLDRARKTVKLGVLRQGEGAETRLLLKVRDADELAIEGIESDPQFLQVRIDPVSEKGTTYRISIRVPPDAPLSNFYSYQRGEVRIRTDHPRLPVLKFHVEFAVTSWPGELGARPLADS